MQNRIEYFIQNNLCEKAIEDYKIITSVSDWLIKYSELYNSVSIKPEGLPSIASLNFGNETFENISKFTHFYEKINSLFE